jgi:hypothetical protein
MCTHPAACGSSGGSSGGYGCRAAHVYHGNCVVTFATDLTVHPSPTYLAPPPLSHAHTTNSPTKHKAAAEALNQVVTFAAYGDDISELIMYTICDHASGVMSLVNRQNCGSSISSTHARHACAHRSRQIEHVSCSNDTDPHLLV